MAEEEGRNLFAAAEDEELGSERRGPDEGGRKEPEFKFEEPEFKLPFQRTMDLKDYKRKFAAGKLGGTKRTLTDNTDGTGPSMSGGSVSSSLRPRQQTSGIYSFQSDRSRWTKLRIRCDICVSSTWFELLTGVVIFVNMVVVILQTDRKAACRWTESEEDCAPESTGMQALNIILLVAYCAESGLRIFVYRWLYFKRWGNVLDCLVILAGIVGEIFGGLFSAVEILRLMRIVRLFRGIRVLSAFRELYLIIHGFISTLKAIFWAAVLMFILLTMWSILSVELLDPINYDLTASGIHTKCRRCPRSLRTVMDANLTFFQTLVVGDGWDNVFLPIMDKEPFTIIIFVAAFFSIALGVMNLILAVIVDGAADAREADIKHQIREKEERRNNAKRQLAKLCTELDFDHNGTLSLPELKEAFDNCTEFRQSLQLLDVDKSDLDCVFRIMDSDKSGDVSYGEFAELLYQIKAQNSRMILMLLKYYSLEIKDRVHEQLKLIQESIDKWGAVPLSPLPKDHWNHRHPVAGSARPNESKLEKSNGHSRDVERSIGSPQQSKPDALAGSAVLASPVSTILSAAGSGTAGLESAKRGLRSAADSDNAWHAPAGAPPRLPGMLDTSLESLESIPCQDESVEMIRGHDRQEALLVLEAPRRRELVQRCRKLEEDVTRTMGAAVREHTTAAFAKVQALLSSVHEVLDPVAFDSVAIHSAAADACNAVFATAPSAARETSMVAPAPPVTPEAHITSPLHEPPALPLGEPTTTTAGTSIKEPARDDQQLAVASSMLEEATRVQLLGMEQRLEKHLRQHWLEESRLAVARHRELMKVLQESRVAPEGGETMLKSISDEGDPENWC